MKPQILCVTAYFLCIRVTARCTKGRYTVFAHGNALTSSKRIRSNTSSEGWRLRLTHTRIVPGPSLKAVGHATILTLAISFTLCVAFDLLFPELAMYDAWRALLPGFKWLNWPDFLLGLVEAYGYGWFFALVWTPVYNVAASGTVFKK